MKKGAIHVDWVISVGIFLVYLIALLILIKPSYKPAYEGDVLTTMIKDEFLGQNNVTAGFVVFKVENCELKEGKDVIEELNNILPDNIQPNEINIKTIETDKSYKAYFLDESDLDLSIGSKDLGKCESVEIKEIFYYNALKNVLNFKIDNFNFPISRKYKITVYQGGKGTEISPKKENGVVSMGEPSSDDKVYVLDWSSAKLTWKNEAIERDNIIINIRVW